MQLPAGMTTAAPGLQGAAGLVTWITGLSNAGKTTVGRAVWAGLRDSGRPALFLDGDVMRQILGEDGGFGTADRRRLAGIYSRMCAELSAQGFDVVCATISMFDAVRDWNRHHLENYFEVFLNVPLTELRRRDVKGHYAAAGSDGELVGVGQQAELPRAPDLTIDNFGGITSSAAAQAILLAIDARRPAPPGPHC